MPARKAVAVLLLAALPMATPALAQTPATTGAGGGPASTATAPNTSSVGRTMPPAGGGAAESRERSEHSPQQKSDDGIQKGICIGCSPK